MDNRSTKGQAADESGRATGTDANRGGKDVKKTQSGKPGERPGWASGLRQLYDAVVEEPLPDSFNDLIAKLDSKN